MIWHLVSWQEGHPAYKKSCFINQKCTPLKRSETRRNLLSSVEECPVKQKPKIDQLLSRSRAGRIHLRELSLCFNDHFSRWTWVSQFIAAKDDGNGGDNWSCKTCKAAVKSSPLTNQHPTFYRPDALPVAEPTVSKHWREKITFHGLAYPKLRWGSSNCSYLLCFADCSWSMFSVSKCWSDGALMLRLSNAGRALSAMSLSRLCAAVVNDLPQLCSAPPTGCLLSDRALDNLIRVSAVSQLTELEVGSVVVSFMPFSIFFTCITSQSIVVKLDERKTFFSGSNQYQP